MLRLPRFTRSLATIATSLIVLLATMPAAYGAIAQPERRPANPGVQVAQPGPPPPPIPMRDRIPVPVPADRQGEHLPPFQIPTNGATRAQVPPEATIRKEMGGENFDVYALDGGEHLALVHERDVNFQRPNGDWVDLELSPSPGGWDGVTGQAGAITVHLPDRLGPGAPVSYTLPEGSISAVPTGVDGARGLQAGLSVSYPNALPGADLTYTLDAHGYKEHFVLRSADRIPPLVWTITTQGLGLTTGVDGSIAIDAAGVPVGSLAPPVLIDATGASGAATYSLAQLADGAYELTLTPDPAFLATASFPVVVDPGVHDNGDDPKEALRDTYVNGSAAGTSYENGTQMWVGNSPNRHTFVRFDISNFNRDERIIYSAVMSLAKVSGSGGDIEAKRVTGNWPSASPGMTFNNMPAVGGVMDPSHTTDQGWSSWNLEEQYQHAIPQVPGLAYWPNEGTRLSKPVGSSAYAFYSTEAFSGNAGDPVLFLSWNDQPNAPTPKYPDPNAVIENESPTLRVDGLPNDFNGDKVYIRFQISDNGTDWTGSHLVQESGWLKQETSYTVPAGALTDGRDYWWRAQSWDAYDLKDGANNVRNEKASAARRFTLSLKHLGTDDRWAIWSRPLGNDMTLQVNQTNGNLMLDAPLSSLATALGDVGVGLSYNAQQSADYGLTPGWDLSVGPVAAGEDLPVELVKMTPQPDAGVKIRMHGGRTLYFPYRSGRVYAAIGSGAGEVRRNNDDGFIYTTPDGGRFTFTSSGKLDQAKPAWSTPGSGDQALDYVYSTIGSNERLTQAVDPFGRGITFDWTDSGDRLESISSADGTWMVSTASGRLTSITTPTNEVLGFSYDAAGKMSEVRDGTQGAPGTGWTMGYTTDPVGTTRIASITPPGAGASNSWTFAYPSNVADYRNTTAAWTTVTDPRGTATAGIPDDYQTLVEFNWAGLPLRTTGAADQTGYRAITTTVWDANNDVLCRRAPAANAVALGATDDSCKDESLTTLYEYETDEPYRMTKISHPAPDPGGTGPRQVETFAYDEGYQGLWAELYGNQNLSGLPKTERLWPTAIDEDWGNNSPAGIGAGDSWSIRFTGVLDLTDKAQDKDYEFNVYSNDGVTITIGNKTIVDCFGQTQNATTSNCGLDQPVEKTLFPGLKPITIEYSELTGTANLKLKWDQGLDSGGSEWQVLPLSRFRPNLGLLTRHTETLDGQTTRETLWNYATDDAKARELPVSRTVQGTGGTDPRTTDYTYNEFGQVLTETTAAGTTTNTYTNDATTSCMDSTTLAEPSATVVSTTTYACDPAGRVTSQTLHVPAVAGTNQTAATDRTIETHYDSVGRVAWVDQLGNGSSVHDLAYTYDLAGRVTSERRLVDGTSVAETNYAYGPMGTIQTTTLPDPDGAGPATRPVIEATSDWVGNIRTQTDPRNVNWVTTYEYDALNRVILKQGPDPDGGGPLTGLNTTTEYRLVTGSNYDNRVTITSPANVPTVRTLDVLGRTISEQVGRLAPSTYTYDQGGNVVSSTTPDPDGTGQLSGVRTDTTYTVHGEPKTVTTAAGTSAASTTTNTYDGAGRLTGVNGPRANDDISYVLDAAGRITKVTQPGIAVPGTATVVSTESKYTAAGERVWMKTMLDADTDFVRNWTFDAMGRQTTFADARGTTTYSYNDVGWLTGADDPRAGVSDLVLSYDQLGRLIERRSGASTDRETFTYNAAGDQTTATAYGTDGVTPTSSVQMRYDHEGRLDQVTAGSDVTSYAFSPATGLVSSIADAAGTTTFTYDANGLLDTLDDPITSGVADYAFDQAGRPTGRIDTGSGLTWTRTYEATTGLTDTQTIKKGTTTLESSDLAYDVAGNVTSRTQSVNGTQDSWTYTYDPAGRLETATPQGGATTTYGYDGASNRISVKVGSNPATTTEYDAASLPVSSSDGTTFAHDALGNLTGIDRPGTSNDWSFGYDAWRRMRTAQNGGSGPSIAYALDALSRVTTRTKGSDTTSYLYRGLSEEQTKATQGSQATTYAYGAGGPIAQVQGGNVRAFLRDLHGDVVGLGTTTGSVAGTRSFDPWGEVRATTGETAWLGFQGDPTDPDTGLVDMLTRNYLPSIGRFTTGDVLLGELAGPASLNQFGYASGDPVSNTDPIGMCANPDYCPQQIGFGTTAYHSPAFVNGINSVGDKWSEAQRWVPPPPPAPVPGALSTYTNRLPSLVRLNARASRDSSLMPTEVGACNGFWGCIGHALGWSAATAGNLAWDIGSGVVGCVRYLIKCADDAKRVALPVVLVGAGATSVAATASACVGSALLACGVVAPLGLGGAAAAGYAAVRSAKEAWEDRQDLFNFADCTSEFFFCDE